ncbi:MAG: sodium:proton antiporter [Lachnospiraceae bacterium]|nr:sodium:proton antiporter [Lachnospiraceae bacterium]
MAAGILSYLLGRFQKDLRSRFADLVTGLTFGLFLYLFWQMLTSGQNGSSMLPVRADIPEICGMGLHFTLDGFRALYGMIAAFMWFMSALFSREYLSHYRNRNRYYLFLLVTLGATEGVFLSADFYTTFIFFEIMSLTSYVWVAHDEKREALRAAGTYLAVAVIGGLVMLMGIFLLYDVTGTLFFDELTGLYSAYGTAANGLQTAAVTQKWGAGTAGASSAMTQLWIAGFCLLFGFGAKAGAFPLHIWLPKAHPVAPAPASALLSGILTKAGMYGILILTAYLFLGNTAWSSMILLLGVCTMVVGAVLALFSVDLKRTLACSSVSQIGFILVGVGMSGLMGAENLIAVRGSLLHMVNHSLIKLTLFMAAGVVYMNVHTLDLNALRGFGRRKPLLHYIFLMGALGIGGVPLWNGYISKTLIHESIVEYTELVRNGSIAAVASMSALAGTGTLFSAGTLQWIEWAFLISGGLTVAYMTKLYVALFVEKNTDAAVQEKYDTLNGKYMNKVSAAALTISASLLPLMGFFPYAVMDRLSQMGQGFMNVEETELTVSYFSVTNLKGAAISLVIGAVVYAVVVRLWMMRPVETTHTVNTVKNPEDAKESTSKGQGRNPRRKYVNRWNSYLDLEDRLYRPLLLQVLPFLCGMVCRVLDSLVDTVVVLLRKTVYRDSRLPQELPEGTAFTHMCACIASTFQQIGNLTYRRKRPAHVDYDHKFAMIHEEWAENSTMIARSMSFGLLLFCIGLILMIAYLFVMDIF